jgi:hypothetical protein
MNRKLQILVLCVVCLTIGGWVVGVVVPWFRENISSWGNNEAMTLFTVLGVIVALSSPFIEGIHQNRLEIKRRKYEEDNKKALYQIDIQVDTSLVDNIVRFSASIQNVGDKRIAVRFSNLYIDSGVEAPLQNQPNMSATKYDFPFILEHKVNNKDGQPDCILCSKLRENTDKQYEKRNLEYPEDALSKENDHNKYKNIFHKNIPLKHLSDESIKYIDSKEKFSEDVVMQFLKKGVYRVTFIVLPFDDNDPELKYGACGSNCQCATKQFYIPNSLETEQLSNTIEEWQ